MRVTSGMATPIPIRWSILTRSVLALSILFQTVTTAQWFALLKTLDRVLGGTHRFFQEGSAFLVGQPGRSPLPEVQGRIEGDPVHPMVEMPQVEERVDAIRHLEERLLGGILRVLPVA
jgi:hypothetical protein